MRLKVIVPTAVIVDAPAQKIIAEALDGSFCLLPRHIDCVAALTAGILTYVDASGQEQYLAVDEGALVKCGDEVRVAAGHAARGTDLGDLQRRVEREFRTLDARERQARAALARLEAGLMRGLRHVEAGR